MIKTIFTPAVYNIASDIITRLPTYFVDHPDHAQSAPGDLFMATQPNVTGMNGDIANLRFPITKLKYDVSFKDLVPVRDGDEQQRFSFGMTSGPVTTSGITYNAYWKNVQWTGTGTQPASFVITVGNGMVSSLFYNNFTFTNLPNTMPAVMVVSILKR